MRFPGRIEPGSGSAVLTGQRVSFVPARIAETRARLSRLFRPGTAGTVIGGTLPESTMLAGWIVVESIAITVTGSSEVPIVAGGVAGWASLAAQAVRSARPLRPRAKRLVICIEWSVVEEVVLRKLIPSLDT